MSRFELLSRFIRQGHTEVVTKLDDNHQLRTIIYLDGDRNDYLPSSKIFEPLNQQHQIAVQQRQSSIISQCQFISNSILAIVGGIVVPCVLGLYNLADQLWHYALATIVSVLIGVALRKLLLYAVHQWISRLDITNE